MKLKKLFMRRSITLGMVTILGLFCYPPAAQAGLGSIIGDEDNYFINQAVTGDFNGDGTLDVVVCSGYADRRTPAATDCIPEDPDDPTDPTDSVGEPSDPEDPECDGVTESVIGAVHIFTSGVGHETPISNANIVIYGKAEDDHFGYSCANAGDFNGDGVEDLVVGAIYNDDGGSNAGAVYVIPGSANIGDITDVEDASVLTILGSDDEEFLGLAVDGVGDADGDGYDDIVIGTPYTTTGSAYLVFGGSSTTTLDLGRTIRLSTTTSRRYVEYYGSSGDGDYAGLGVAGIGDVNGDGLADFAVGAPKNDDGGESAGKVYIVLGGSRPSRDRLSLERHAAAQLTGEAERNYVGGTIAGAGDVDGDGYTDVLIGSSNNDEGGTSAGAAYVYYGSADPQDTGLADTQKFVGGSAYDDAGSAVAGVGDVDHDGLDDFMIGEPGYYGESAFLVLGSDTYDTPTGLKAGPHMQEFTSTDADTGFGYFVGPAGDLDGDGTIYFFIGAPYNNDGGGNAGKIHIRCKRT